MHSLNIWSKTTTIWFGCIGVLQSGSNWNNAENAGIRYHYANNRSSNSNTNISTRLELKTNLRSPEQQPDPNQNYLVKHKANHPGVLVPLEKFSRNGRAEP